MKIYPSVNDTVSQLLKLMVSALCVLPWSIAVNIKPAAACSCLPAGPPLTELGQATAVFAGEVSDITQTTTGVEVSFSVSEVWKGNLNPTLVVTTGPHSAACGYPFQMGQAYLVYAYGGKNGRLGANLCSRTTLLSNAEADLVELGDSALPTLEEGAPLKSPRPFPALSLRVQGSSPNRSRTKIPPKQLLWARQNCSQAIALTL